MFGSALGFAVFGIAGLIMGLLLFYDELQIENIDTVDLLVQLQVLTGAKIAPGKFREARTIGDVPDALTVL